MVLNKKPIRLILSDMDGTLLNADKCISRCNREAIQKAKKRGIDFTICTGRIQTMAQYYIQDLEISVPVITANGALIWDSLEKRELWGQPVDREEAQALLEYCCDKKLDYCALTMSDSYFSPGNIRRRRFEQYNQIAMRGGFVPMTLREFDYDWSCIRGKNIYKILIYETQRNQLEGVKEKLKELHNTGYTSSEEGLLDVAHNSVSKGNGLLHLAEIMGISPDEICAIGDYENDISMLQESGFPVAMGNGCKQIKEVAMFVTKSNEEDGVAYAIEQLL
ncbi:Cof-type HAD-IIB family hydrolase [Lachnospiraceae bacterium OttesenSCG-928-E19]|nr:Cof-type HAD-IIB family hydrolase [Lachnospiraceae bacterium OttesenSCG-928-E19]